MPEPEPRHSPEVLVVRRQLFAARVCIAAANRAIGRCGALRARRRAHSSAQWGARAHHRQGRPPQDRPARGGDHGVWRTTALWTSTENPPQPRSLELFHQIGVADEITKRAITTPVVKLYELPEGRKALQTFEMSPVLEPTPSCPYVRPLLILLADLPNLVSDEHPHAGPGSS